MKKREIEERGEKNINVSGVVGRSLFFLPRARLVKQPCSSSTGASSRCAEAWSRRSGSEKEEEMKNGERRASLLSMPQSIFLSCVALSPFAFHFCFSRSSTLTHRIYSVLNSLGLYNKNAKILFLVREKKLRERKSFFFSSVAIIDRPEKRGNEQRSSALPRASLFLFSSSAQPFSLRGEERASP